MLPLPVPLSEAVTLGLWVGEGIALCDGVSVPVSDGVAATELEPD